jgi:hypothetical protein
MTTNGKDVGTVTFWSNDRNYGFIRPDTGDRDVSYTGQRWGVRRPASVIACRMKLV